MEKKIRKDITHKKKVRIEVFRAAVLMSRETIKSAFLLNGWAAFALMAYVANTGEKALWSLLCFGVGAASAVYASMRISLGIISIYDDDNDDDGGIDMTITKAVAWFSFSLFILGLLLFYYQIA